MLRLYEETQMKAEEKCFECLARLVEQAANLATKDESLRAKAIAEGQRVLRDNFSTDEVTIAIATKFHRVIREMTQNPDPYREMKEREIAIGRDLAESVGLQYRDGFSEALRLAVAGNVIDFFRPLDTVIEQMKEPVDFVIDDSREFESKLGKARNILYLADNAGEVFFDMRLLKLMRESARVIYVVKGSPVQNDVTMEDLGKAGLEGEVGEEVMTTGAANPGVVFSEASEEFKRAFRDADLILAKGMGYYEALSELPADGRVLHCMVAKCGAVARSIGVPLGSCVAALR
jgi:uncharacterized protein with ATP-grasp and redox domains